MTPEQHDLYLQMLDRLARLDPARKALQQELDLALTGQPSEVSRAYQGLQRLMGSLGIYLDDD